MLRTQDSVNGNVDNKNNKFAINPFQAPFIAPVRDW